MKVHRFVASHRTGCVEMKVNSSMNSRGNGRSMLNRFVLDKCDLQMNYNIWSPLLDGKTAKDEMQGRAIILKETVALSDQISQHSLL